MSTGATTIACGIAGVGVLGPGYDDWAQAAPLLRTPHDWQARPTVVPPPNRLPPNERRRAGTIVKAALVVADQACAMAGAAPERVATVFTSSSGDPVTCHALLDALAQPERLVSPTRFTNSVHNAPAGYWHIATQSRAASTSLAAYDASTSAGLLEAAAQCAHHAAPVLLVACDMPYPEPLHALRALPDVFAFALLLVPAGTPAHWRLTLSLTLPPGPASTPCDHAGLDALRAAVPTARALPLLQALARLDTPPQPSTPAGAHRATAAHAGAEPRTTIVLAGDGLDLALQVSAA
ncbi:MAG: beta-ketoacyl synthase chain length factor [Ideonella sp.]|nr:beta-ketoacyl synthase chain length factor [Ideonella sp.]MCC7455670.1 beta-ketoacyl synthase chain length factor [Nitrospira sp.]